MLRHLTVRRSAAGLALAVLALAACDTTSSRTATVTPTPPGSPGPMAVSPSPGERRLSLFTHCGVSDADVDGVHWVADPPLGNGNPPDGWGNPETPGRWRQTGETTALFLADSGVAASFVRAESPDTGRGCA